MLRVVRSHSTASLLTADGIDQFELDRLAPGEDAPPRQARNLVRLDAAALLDEAEEPAVALVDHRLGDLLALLAEGLEGRRDGLEVAALDLVELDAELVERLARPRAIE